MIGGQKPKVSVIMGVYNCENTIAESHRVNFKSNL